MIHIIIGAADVEIVIASFIFSINISLVVIYLTIEQSFIFFTNSFIGLGLFLSYIL